MRTRHSTPVRVGRPPSFCRAAGGARHRQLVLGVGSGLPTCCKAPTAAPLLPQDFDRCQEPLRGRAGARRRGPLLAVGTVVALTAAGCALRRALPRRSEQFSIACQG